MSSGLVYVKKHLVGETLVVAICDHELLGKKLADEEKGITVYVDPAFYGGEVVSVEEALEVIKRASIANLLGKRIVEAAINEGLVLREAVISISGIPHAQVLVMGVSEE